MGLITTISITVASREAVLKEEFHPQLDILGRWRDQDTHETGSVRRPCAGASRYLPTGILTKRWYCCCSKRTVRQNLRPKAWRAIRSMNQWAWEFAFVPRSAHPFWWWIKHRRKEVNTTTTSQYHQNLRQCISSRVVAEDSESARRPPSFYSLQYQNMF